MSRWSDFLEKDFFKIVATNTSWKQSANANLVHHMLWKPWVQTCQGCWDQGQADTGTQIEMVNKDLLLDQEHITPGNWWFQSCSVSTESIDSTRGLLFCPRMQSWKRCIWQWTRVGLLDLTSLTFILWGNENMRASKQTKPLLSSGWRK